MISMIIRATIGAYGPFLHYVPKVKLINSQRNEQVRRIWRIISVLIADTYNEESSGCAEVDDRVQWQADLTDTCCRAISPNRHRRYDSRCCAVPGERCAIPDCSAASGRRAVAIGTPLPEEEPRTSTFPGLSWS